MFKNTWFWEPLYKFAVSIVFWNARFFQVMQKKYKSRYPGKATITKHNLPEALEEEEIRNIHWQNQHHIWNHRRTISYHGLWKTFAVVTHCCNGIVAANDCCFFPYLAQGNLYFWSFVITELISALTPISEHVCPKQEILTSPYHANGIISELLIHMLRGLDIHLLGRLAASLFFGDNFCDTCMLFWASYSFWKGIRAKRKDFALEESQFFCFGLHFFPKGDKITYNYLPSMCICSFLNDRYGSRIKIDSKKNDHWQQCTRSQNYKQLKLLVFRTRLAGFGQ